MTAERAEAGERAPRVLLGERAIELQPGESVLEALERAGVETASGCRAGSCCKCMLRAADPPAASQRALRPTLRSQGWFLACQARPSEDLVLLEDAAAPTRAARVDSIELLGPNVARLRLRLDAPLDYHAGQYLDLLHPSGATRSYSIASLPSDGFVELHVGRVAGGLVSEWMHAREVGDEMHVRGPHGQCFHLADDSARPLLLVGSGTGLSPLVGIARDALDQGHEGPIDLVHGGLDPSRLYLKDELEALAARHSNLRVHFSVLRDACEGVREARLEQVATELVTDAARTRAFLCGNPDLVAKLRKALFLAGLPSADLLTDPFTRAAA